ncbi:tRNA1(Val) (adenine(37)-N6)-methyltransferase [Candidatus Moduliflexota bacterium]
MRNRTPSGKSPAEAGTAETIEKVGSLLLAQPARGYRYGVDPFLLSSFVMPRLREKIVDLGTGCGIIALLLASRWPTVKIWGVEIQTELSDIAKKNVLTNNLGDRCTILEGDIRRIGSGFPEGSFQRAVSNPPFRAPRSGRISSEPQRAIARQEISLAFRELASTVSRLLGHGGIFDFIHLPGRLVEIFGTLTAHGLEPKRLRLVHSFRDGPPEMALLSARKEGRPGLEVLPPLVIFRSPGSYTAEMRKIAGNQPPVRGRINPPGKRT